MRSHLTSSIGLGLMLFVATAGAETVHCTPIDSVPYTISAPGIYCLTADLAVTDMVSGSAIEIAADNVVVDLNGHELANDITPEMKSSVEASGVAAGLSSLARRNITIRNGTVRGFHVGIQLYDSLANGYPGPSRGHLVEDIYAEDNFYCGIAVSGTSGTVRRNRVRVPRNVPQVGFPPMVLGIAVGGEANSVLDNDVFGSQAASLNRVRGIQMSDCEYCFAVGNRIRRVYIGIFMPPGSNNTTTTHYRDNLTIGAVLQPYVGGSDAGNNK